MSEEHVSDLLAGYALAILEEDELSRVQAHLGLCEVCQRAYAGYAETVAQLAQVTAHPIATPELIPLDTLGYRQGKVLSRVQAASAAQAVGVSDPITKEGLGDFWQRLMARPLGLAFGVLMVLAIVVLGFSTLMLRQEVKELQAQVPGGYMQVVRLNGTDLAPDSSGYMMVFRGQNYGTLAVTHAPLLDGDRQYQMWLIRDEVRTSGGVFSVNEVGYGNLMVSADVPLDSFDGFGITIEPLGGSPQPTGEKVWGT